MATYYQTAVHVDGTTDNRNGIAFATAAEAETAGHELLSRWMSPTGFHVAEVSEAEFAERKLALYRIGADGRPERV